MSVAFIGSTNAGIGALTAPERSISACAAGALLTQTASRSSWNVVVGPAGLHRLREVLGIPPGRRVLVALVDEELTHRLVLRRTRPIAPAAAGPHEREAAFQLFPVDPESELAVLDRRRGSGVSDFGSYAPQSQTMTSPAPYCRFGITPSKSKYSSGWSSTWTAHAPHRRVQRWSLRHGPAREHAAHLQVEVPVQAGRTLPLDDEPGAMAGPDPVVRAARGSRRRGA